MFCMADPIFCIPTRCVSIFNCRQKVNASFSLHQLQRRKRGVGIEWLEHKHTCIGRRHNMLRNATAKDKEKKSLLLKHGQDINERTQEKKKEPKVNENFFIRSTYLCQVQRDGTLVVQAELLNTQDTDAQFLLW